MQEREPKTIDLIEYMKNFDYIKKSKKQFYFIINPVAHFKELVRVFKNEEEK